MAHRAERLESQFHRTIGHSAYVEQVRWLDCRKLFRAPQPAPRSVSSARTRVVKRTRNEKQRQRSSSSSEDPPDPLLSSSVRNGAALPSASAPVQRSEFRREELRHRFSSGALSSGPSSRTAKSDPVKRKGKSNFTSTLPPANKCRSDKHLEIRKQGLSFLFGITQPEKNQ